MSKDREWNRIDSNERRGAERLFGALAGVDEELLARSEEKTDVKKVIPLWRYSKVVAACLCVAVLGVAYWAVSRVGIIGGGTKDMAPAETSMENAGYSLEEYSTEEATATCDDMDSASYEKDMAGDEASYQGDTSMAEKYVQDTAEQNEPEAAQEPEAEREDSIKQEAVVDMGAAEFENMELDLTLEDAKNTEVLGAYVPDVPGGYVPENVTRTFSKNSEGEKEYYELYILWCNGMDDIRINITQLDAKTAHLYRGTLTNVKNEASYNTHLYDVPYGETVPEEYRQVFENPVFAAEDMSLDIVKARMKVYGDSGDTNTPRGNFSILYENGILLEFSGDCDEQAVWDMLKDMAG